MKAMQSLLISVQWYRWSDVWLACSKDIGRDITLRPSIRDTTVKRYLGLWQAFEGDWVGSRERPYCENCSGLRIS
jgi:hypothetical protein